jgi:hypothetical protein
MIKKILTAIVVLVVAAYVLGLSLTSEIRTETEIAASPDEVWRVLTDFPSYPEWSPFIRKIEGQPVVGETLDVEMQPLHMESSQNYSPEVLVVNENEELRWIGKLLLPGIFDGEHYFRIEADGSGSRFVHGENFRGILLAVIDVNDFVPSFEATNEALKQRAEGG